MLRILLLVAAAFFLNNSAFAQVKEIRHALVISQTDYSHGFSPVTSAENEGRLIEKALSATGFTVMRASDLSRARLEEVLAEFRAKLSAVGPDAIGFVYYTGHGVQHPKNQDSYLLGIDADLQNLSDLPRFGVDMKSLTTQFAAIEAKAVFLVFDACRNTPPIPGFKANAKGIGAIEPRYGMLVAFSTGPNALAQEGIYAPILAEEIKRFGQTADAAFAATQRRVAFATGRRQLPWSNNLLYETICFAGCATSRLTPSPEPDATSVIEPEIKVRRQGDLEILHPKVRAVVEKARAAQRIAKETDAIARENARKAREAATRAQTSPSQTSIVFEQDGTVLKGDNPALKSPAFAVITMPGGMRYEGEVGVNFMPNGAGVVYHPANAAVRELTAIFTNAIIQNYVAVRFVNGESWEGEFNTTGAQVHGVSVEAIEVYEGQAKFPAMGQVGSAARHGLGANWTRNGELLFSGQFLDNEPKELMRPN